MKYKIISYLRCSKRIQICFYDTKYDDRNINIANWKGYAVLSFSGNYYDNTVCKNGIDKNYIRYNYDNNNRIINTHYYYNDNNMVYCYDENGDINNEI